MLQSDARVGAGSGTVSPGVSAEQARDDFREVLDDTEALIGGTWQNSDDPTARGCAVQWGLEGETYASLRITTLEASPTLDADRGLVNWVQRAWERDGYAVVRTEVGPVSQLVGTTTRVGELLILRVSERGITLQGESACRPAE